LAAAVLLALVSSGSALAALSDHGDPQKKITRADQARAKAMLLRRVDLPPVFKATRGLPDSTHSTCKASDESDLTMTGNAESKEFNAQIVFAQSSSRVYETLADARESWRRNSSPAGERCARTLTTREYKKQGLTMRSLKRTPFPNVAPAPGRTLAYRLTMRGQGLDVYLDFVVLEHGRAQSFLAVGGVTAPWPRAETVRLARLLAGRMKTAMRGA
jgi:hypothetical protein